MKKSKNSKNNKEKVKVVEQYMKNMKVIDEAFNIIKETSGITDIEEIMNTFIKSEEQNYSLFNYVNVLTQDIDFLEENNKDLSFEIDFLEVRKMVRNWGVNFENRKSLTRSKRQWKRLLKKKLKSKKCKKLFVKRSCIFLM